MTIITGIPKGWNTADWAFHPANPNRLPEKAEEVFKLIKDLSLRFGHAYAKQKWFAKRLDITKRYFQKIVKKLVNYGLVEKERHQQNFYFIKIFFSKRAPKLPDPDLANVQQSTNRNAAKPAPVRATRSDLNKSAQAMLDLGSIPAVQLEDTEAAAQLEEIKRLEAALVEEPTIEPEIKEAIEEAAKAVRKEKRDRDVRLSAKDYLDRVNKKLDGWQINAPGRAIGDIVMKFWNAW